MTVLVPVGKDGNFLDRLTRDFCRVATLGKADPDGFILDKLHHYKVPAHTFGHLFDWPENAVKYDISEMMERANDPANAGARALNLMRYAWGAANFLKEVDKYPWSTEFNKGDHALFETSSHKRAFYYQHYTTLARHLFERAEQYVDTDKKIAYSLMDEAARYLGHDYARATDSYSAATKTTILAGFGDVIGVSEARIKAMEDKIDFVGNGFNKPWAQQGRAETVEQFVGRYMEAKQDLRLVG